VTTLESRIKGDGLGHCMLFVSNGRPSQSRLGRRLTEPIIPPGRDFVSIVHSAAMIATGGLCAWLVYRYLGLKFVSRSWFNLDATWAVTLVLVGAVSLAVCLET
jgi:hypothetical protein